MEFKDLAPWIAIAFTLALSILVPLFTQIANNNHQRKMQREKIEYEKSQEKRKAYEQFLLDVGMAITAYSRETVEQAGTSLHRMYIYAPTKCIFTISGCTAVRFIFPCRDRQLPKTEVSVTKAAVFTGWRRTAV